MSVTLDPSVIAVVEDTGGEWVVRVDGYWSRRGMVAGVTPRWYYLNERGHWWHLTELPDGKNYVGGVIEGYLPPNDPPFRFAPDPVPTGQLYHVSCAPQEVQLRAAGFHVDPAAAGELRASDGQQQRLDGWV